MPRIHGPESVYIGSTGISMASEMTNTTLYYELLGVEKSDQTTQDDIKRAWRKAALRLHPDRNPDGRLALVMSPHCIVRSAVGSKRGALHFPSHRVSFDERRVGAPVC